MLGRVTGWLLAWLALGAGCAAHKPPLVAEAPRAELLHRPSWIRSMAADVDVMVRCLDGRETPAYVLLVLHDPSRITAVTTIDAHDALEHCVVDGGRVVDRRPAAESLADYAGLPLFSLGPQRPKVARHVVLEEVVSDGHVLGWLYWRNSDEDAATTADRSAATFMDELE